MVTKAPVPYLRVVRQPAPAAGSELVVTTPGQGVWRVVSMAFLLTTSAVVGGRRVSLLADDQTDVWYATVSTADVTASQAVRLGAYAGAANVNAAGLTQSMTLPTDGLILQPGHRLRTATLALDVGDQYSAVSLQVQEYPQGPDDEWLPTLDTQLTQMG